jgi:hypothetical protein
MSKVVGWGYVGVSIFMMIPGLAMHDQVMIGVGVLFGVGGVALLNQRWR